MNNTELFEAIGAIDSELIARGESEVVRPPKHAWTKWLPLAACLCFMLLCVTIIPILRQTANLSGNNSNLPLTSANTGNPISEGNVSLFINQLGKAPIFQNAIIALNGNDFVPMTDDEFLNYYGVSFSIDKAVPVLELQPQNPKYSNGIFKNNSRGIYYDSHTFVFASDGNSERIEITLGKTAYYPGLIVRTDKSGVQLKQSQINGFAVTIFQYTGENGSTCYYTEFLNNGIAYCITSYNLSRKDYATALNSVIANNIDAEADISGAGDTHTVIGTVNAVDKNANLISISMGDGVFSALKIYLSDGETKNYSVGDKARVNYVGNPFTICTIWEQQLKSIVKN